MKITISLILVILINKSRQEVALNYGKFFKVLLKPNSCQKKKENDHIMRSVGNTNNRQKCNKIQPNIILKDLYSN